MRDQYLLDLSAAGIRPWEFDLITVGDFVCLIEHIVRGGHKRVESVNFI